MLAIFMFGGSWPSDNDLLKMSISEGARRSAHDLRIVPGKPSLPVAFVMAIDDRSLRTRAMVAGLKIERLFGDMGP